MNNYRMLIALVRALPRETVLAAANQCDGHTIFKPQAFLNAGLPDEIVDHFTRRHNSGSLPKTTIYVAGRPVEELTGVYGLDLLRFLAYSLDVEYASALGRGTEARHIKAALQRHFDSTRAG